MSSTMSQSNFPSPPDHPPTPGPNPYPRKPVPVFPALALKPWLRNATPAMSLRIAREELEQVVCTHDRYLNDYHVAHGRIHSAYALRRTLETARHQIPAGVYDHTLRIHHQRRDEASNAMRRARENVKVLREDIKRMQETVIAITRGRSFEKIFSNGT